MERTIHTAYVPYAYEQYKKLQLSLTNRATHLRANAMAWLTSEKHAPPHSGYHVEFGRSALKDVGNKYKKKTKIEKRWNSALLRWEAWLTPRYTPHPLHVLPRQIS